MFDAKVYSNRRNRLRQKINNGIILFLGNPESPMNYPSNTFHFRQDSSFLYYFGLDMPNLAGVLDVEENDDVLFGDDFDLDDIIWMGPQPSMKQLGEKVGVSNTEPYGHLVEKIHKAIEKGRKIHFLPPYRGETTLLLEDLLGINQKLIQSYVSEELIKAVVAMRSIKDTHEIAEIEKAANIAYEMHVAAMKRSKPGVYEREITGVVEGIPVSHGGLISFPIILSQNGETLHNHYHGNKLEEGKMMLTDTGAETNMHYASDCTRTVPVGGKFNQRQKDVYQIVLDANNKAREATKPGVSYLSIHTLAVTTIVEGLKNLGLMKGDVQSAVNQGAHAMFMPHGLGHMMGLDVHDMEGLGENYVGYDEETKRSSVFGFAGLRLGRKLHPGFVITNEPGIYFIPELIKRWKEDKKFTEYIDYEKVEAYIGFGGIRLEDDILVTENGCRILGDKRIPITPEEVEETMNG